MTEKEIEEDFLQVDKQIPGQNYACLSFVSPDKILQKKEMFMYHNYIKYLIKDLNQTIDLTLKDGQENAVNNVKNKITELLDSNYDTFKDKYLDYTFSEGERLQNEFNLANDFQTNVRGIKVRGVYESYKEAQIRAKVLQKMDKHHNVFIGQVGYWLPWDPEADKIKNQEYLNNELNNLMKEYKSNETKRDMFYQEHKNSFQNSNKSDFEILQETDAEDIRKKKEKQQTTSNIIDDTINSLQKDDPWLQRKNQDSNTSSNIVSEINNNVEESSGNVEESSGNVEEPNDQDLSDQTNRLKVV